VVERGGSDREDCMAGEQVEKVQAIRCAESNLGNQ
jgi:hypothetical protein